jgi:hypothetical protein
MRPLEENLNKIKELSLELSVMNITLLKNDGDLQEKSVKNFAAEIKRINDTIFDLAGDSLAMV